MKTKVKSEPKRGKLLPPVLAWFPRPRRTPDCRLCRWQVRVDLKGPDHKRLLFEVAGGIILVYIQTQNLQGKSLNIKERAKKLKSDIPAVFIALRDKNTPLIAKIVAGLTVGYALSPIDLVPDFIPVLGYLDDIILLPALVALTVRLIPEEVWIRSKIRAEGLWENGKPKKWYYSIPVFIIWGLILWIIIKAIWF